MDRRFEERMEDLSISGTEVVIMADFNIEQIKSLSFKSIMKTCGLTQLINKPILVTCDSSTLIDPMYVNHPVFFSSRGVIPIGVRDHHLVYSIRKKFKAVSPLHHVYVKNRDQKRLDETNFISDFNSVDWNSLKSLP